MIKRSSRNTSSKSSLSLCWHLWLNLISFISHCLWDWEGFLRYLFWSMFSPRNFNCCCHSIKVGYLIVGSYKPSLFLAKYFLIIQSLTTRPVVISLTFHIRSKKNRKWDHFIFCVIFFVPLFYWQRVKRNWWGFGFSVNFFLMSDI